MRPTASELAAHYRSGRTTPSEAVEEVLATIERLDPTLAAWRAVDADYARTQAEAATVELAAGRDRGPFHGIPYALKDIIDLAGAEAQAGSAALAGRVAPTTATIAGRLEAAGGILVGKTHTVEFALGGWGTNHHLGTPRNPWDATHHRVPGGSSSGTGVAVASGMVPLGIGTDTGGSVRLPSTLCGIVGLKTTEGVLPTDGIVPLSHTLDTPGPMARSVSDTALLWAVLQGGDPLHLAHGWQVGSGLFAPARSDLVGVRLGVLPEPDRRAASQAVLDGYDATLERLRALGAETTPIALPLPYDELAELTFTIVTPEAWHHHGALLADDDAPLDPHVRARGVPGRDVPAWRYLDALTRRRRLRQDYLNAIDGLEAVVVPGTPGVAPRLDQVDESTTPAHFTRAANLLGLAALALPTGLSPDGLPVGIQLLGRGHDEDRLLALGAVLEADLPPLPAPPLS